MTATLGKIEEFDGGKEEWPQYVERMGYFFTTNAITDADQKPFSSPWLGQRRTNCYEV